MDKDNCLTKTVYFENYLMIMKTVLLLDFRRHTKYVAAYLMSSRIWIIYSQFRCTVTLMNLAYRNIIKYNRIVIKLCWLQRWMIYAFTLNS